jgi:hypothetical protein
MKLWRKLAMKEGKQDGRRPGRQIKQMHAMQEYMFKQQPRLTPLLEVLFKRVGIATPQRVPMKTEEATNETV